MQKTGLAGMVRSQLSGKRKCVSTPRLTLVIELFAVSVHLFCRPTPSKVLAGAVLSPFVSARNLNVIRVAFPPIADPCSLILPLQFL